MVSELGNLTNTWGKYGVLTACINSVSGQHEKELGDRKTNSRKNFLFKLIKHGSYSILTTVSYVIHMHHVNMAQQNNETI